MTIGRWIALVMLVVFAIFAWKGGTFSERNFLALKKQESTVVAREKQLMREVDSLKAYRDSLETNPAVQERVARDKLGMIRPGEITFTVVRDSGTD